MAVQAQREAKEALHEAADVALPGDLLSRLCAIPFTAEVPPGGSLGGLSGTPGGVVMDGASGGWSVDLTPEAPPARSDQARWLRRGVGGTLAGLGLGVLLLAVTLPGDDSLRTGRTPVAGPSVPQERTEVVPPVTRAIAGDGRSTLAARFPGGTP